MDTELVTGKYSYKSNLFSKLVLFAFYSRNPKHVRVKTLQSTGSL